nr:MAG TPA: hypothetical protein [Caudoviricetes sp.]
MSTSSPSLSCGSSASSELSLSSPTMSSHSCMSAKSISKPQGVFTVASFLSRITLTASYSLSW